MARRQTPAERRSCCDFTELQAIACAAIVIADAGPGKTTGPMWTRLWSLLNDRVRRGLDEAMIANYGPGSAERRMTEQCSACRAPRGVLCRRDCTSLIKSNQPSRPVATCSKARAEEILNSVRVVSPLGMFDKGFNQGLDDAAEALDRAGLFMDEETAAEITRLVREIESKGPTAMNGGRRAVELATACRKAGLVSK